MKYNVNYRLHIKQLWKRIIIPVVLAVSLAACSAGKQCDICNSKAISKIKNATAKEQYYYCEKHIPRCSFCLADSEACYESVLDMTVFICNRCLKEVAEMRAFS